MSRYQLRRALRKAARRQRPRVNVTVECGCDTAKHMADGYVDFIIAYNRYADALRAIRDGNVPGKRRTWNACAEIASRALER